MPDSTARPSLRRDVRIIGLIAAAHFFSHFFQLTLPPLFPLLKMAMVVVLATQGGAFGAAHRGARGKSVVMDVRVLLTAPILSAFAYFAFIATALIGVQTFGVTALVRVYETPMALATAALTAFLLGGAVGILAGGLLADRTSRHDVVAMVGLIAAAGFMMLLATGGVPASLLPALLGFTGFCHGVTGPSRDMLVRAATPPGASGKVFGFVYSGLDLGSCLTPLAFGWLLDHGDPRMLFVAVGILMLGTIGTVVQVRRNTRQPAPARA